MRIALANPTYWPEVRRGSERVVHELATGLAARGHQVTILTSHRAPASSTIEDGVRVVRAWRPPGFRRLRHYEDFAHNAPNVFLRLLAGRYDLVHAFFPVDGWAASKARRLGGPPLVFTLHGAPTRYHLVRRRYRIEMLRAAIEGASEVTVLSEFMVGFVRRYFQVDPRIIPAGVQLDRFVGADARADRPTLLCAADLSDPRKRGPLLLEAFDRLRGRRPDARLVIALGGDSRAEPPRGPGIEGVRCDTTDALARQYAHAWATVLPSIEEAFGLVVLESMAAGTPVVAARSGASPELLDDDRLGGLFEPDDPAAMAIAMERALEAPPQPDTVAACRRRAGEFGWERVLDALEEIYAKALSGSSPSVITTSRLAEPA